MTDHAVMEFQERVGEKNMNWKTITSSFAVLCAVCLYCPPAIQAEIVYNNFGPGDTFTTATSYVIAGPDAEDGELDIAMPFTPGGDYRLGAITVAVHRTSGFQQIDVILASDSSGFPGGILEQTSLSPLPSWPGAALTATFAGSTVLSAGQQYWVWLSAPGDGEIDWHHNSVGDSGTIAASGGGNWNAVPNFSRGAFRVEGTLIPEPGSAVMMALGVAGLALYRRRRSA